VRGILAIAISQKVYDELFVTPGDYFEIRRKGDQVILTPKALVGKSPAES
jgi:hypothetical protein